MKRACNVLTGDIAGFIMEKDFGKDDDEDSTIFVERFREPGGWKPVPVENIGISLLSCRLNLPYGTSRYGRGFLRYGNRVYRK